MNFGGTSFGASAFAAHPAGLAAPGPVIPVAAAITRLPAQPRQAIPLLLSEAVVSLFEAGAAGSPISAQPVWMGACANRLRIHQDFEEMLVAGSGDAYRSAKHLDENWTIEIERTWVIPRATLQDVRPRRNGQYVMELVWESEGLWYREVAYGVTFRAADRGSNGTNHFGVSQSWRAKYLVGDGGTGPADVFTPLPGGEEDEQSVGFFYEEPLLVGTYLLGHYRWPVSVDGMEARAIAYAPQTSPSTLTLEVNGALTASTLTLPVGAALTEVSATVDLTGLSIAAGQSVRWKATGGPATGEEAASRVAVAMRVKPD